jgi:hypothetical protein
MTESKGKKAWYFRPWAVAVWIIIAIPVLLSVVPLGDSNSEDGSAHLSMHAGTFNANNNLSTGSTTSGADTALFSARHVAVLVRTDHKVARGVGRALAKRLEGIDFIEQVDLLMPDEHLKPGQPLPDFFVVVELPSFSSSGLLVTGRTVKADVKVNLGRNPVQSDHSFQDQYSAPLARVNMDSHLNHESVSRGYETASAKYYLVIEDISKQVGGAVEENLKAWHSAYLELRTVPDELMPAYVPPPKELPLPQNDSLELALSGNELMTRNRSAWIMESFSPFEELALVHARLLEEGWRVDPKVWKPREEGFLCFQASKGAQIYEVFEEDKGFQTKEPTEPARLFFYYLDRMERDEVLPVFDAMIADPNLPAETGLCFMSCMDSGQRTRLIETWMDRKALPFEARVAIVRELERSGQKDKAMARLQPLYVAALLSSGDEADEVKKLGRKITGDKKWKPALPTEEEFIAVGAQPMGTNTTIEVEVGLNDPAAVITRSGEESEFELLSLEVGPSSIPEGLYTFSMSCRSGSELRSAGSSSSTAHSLEHPWTGRLSQGFSGNHFSATATEIGTNRFSIVLEIQHYLPR